MTIIYSLHQSRFPRPWYRRYVTWLAHYQFSLRQALLLRQCHVLVLKVNCCWAGNVVSTRYKSAVPTVLIRSFNFIIIILIIVSIYLPDILTLKTDNQVIKSSLQPELSSPERYMLSHFIAVESLRVTVCRTLMYYIRTLVECDTTSLWLLITADSWWKSSISQPDVSHELSFCGVRCQHLISVSNSYINVRFLNWTPRNTRIYSHYHADFDLILTPNACTFTDGYH